METIRRRQRAKMSVFTTNCIHFRNPWVAAWWSAAFPGFGHLLLGAYFKGFLLMFWEIIVNVNAHINYAIIYSFLGDFEKAKAVLNKGWLLLYLPLYMQAIWDSYRSAIDLNKEALLAQREDVQISPVAINSLGINYLDKRNPWVAAVWSLFVPGMGHFYARQLIDGFFILAWWMAITYLSHLYPAVQLSFTGSFSQAGQVLNPQWLLFMPSIYGFAFYSAYVSTVENNKLFESEQAYFLKSNYQCPQFKMPV